MTWLRCVLIGCCMLVCMPCSAATITQKKGGATLEVQFEADRPALSLADTIMVTLTVEGTCDLQVQLPREWPTSSPWLLIEPAKIIKESLGLGRMRWQQLSRCAPRQTGQAVSFRFPEVQVQGGDNGPRKIDWDPVLFTVTASITQPDRNALRDITGIEAVPEIDLTPAPSWFGWMVALTLSLLVVVAVVGRRFLRRKKTRSPVDRALYECRRLLAMKLAEQGRGERFIALLTLLVRDYLQREFQLPARRQTTPELLQSLSEVPLLIGEDKEFLSDLLVRADMVKYARVEIACEECHAYIGNFRQFLHRRQNVSVKKPG